MKRKLKNVMAILTLLFLVNLSLALQVKALEAQNLIAGGGDGVGLTVGSVEVSNNATHLNVTYVVFGDWVLNETHLAVADSLEYIPQTKKNNPIPGQFNFTMEHDPVVQVFGYIVPLAGLTGEIYVAAQAVVTNMAVPIYDPIDPTIIIGYLEESAWAEGPSFEGKNWATYFTYTITVDEIPS